MNAPYDGRCDGLREAVTALRDEWLRVARENEVTPEHATSLEWRARELTVLLDAVPEPHDPPAADLHVVTRDGFVTWFNAQSDAEAAAYKAGWADALSEVRDEDDLNSEREESQTEHTWRLRARGTATP